MAISPVETEMKGAYYALVEHLAQHQLGSSTAPRLEGDTIQQTLQAMAAAFDMAADSIFAELYCQRRGLPFKETLARDVAKRVAELKGSV